MAAEKLDHSQLADLLVKYEGWDFQAEPSGLVKTFKFKNFVEAFAWMTKVAMHAERMNHHPEWFNVYGTVRVTLTTHDAGGITTLDAKMLEIMEGLPR